MKIPRWMGRMSIKTKAMLTFSVFLVFLVGLAVLGQIILGEQDARVVSLAGKQRMLSQKLTNDYLLSATGMDETAAANIVKTMSLFERSHKGLLDGDPALGLPGTGDPEIRAQMAKVGELWEAFKQQVKEQNTKEVARLSGPFLAEIDTAVGFYENVAAQRVGRIQWILWIVAVLGFGACVVIWVLMHRTLVRPLLRIRDHLSQAARGDFGAYVAVEAGDEVGEVATSFNQLLDRLQEARTHLDETLHGLEERVRERTRELSEAEEKFRELFEQAGDGILLIRATDFRITDANQRASELTGYSHEDLIGRGMWELHPPEEVERVRTFCLAVLEGQAKRCPHFPVVRKDGSVFRMEGTESVVEIHGERYLQRIFQDVEVELRLQEQLMQAEKLTVLGELTAGVAHELNNPLTSVMGFAELAMMKEECPEEIRQDLKKVFKGGQRASRIVKNLLTFARGKKPEKTPTQVNDIVYQIMELMEHGMQAHNVTVVTNLDTAIPCVVADPHQIQQVFLNVINNAYQAMLPTGGTLTITSGYDANARRVRVAFADAGSGISRDHMGKLFEPFFTTKPVGQGTGLGLSVSYGIIHDHGGRIWAESREGQGATFVVELPEVGDVESADSSAEPSQIDQSVAPTDSLRILVVDDEQGVRDLCRHILQQIGHQPDLAHNGREAIRKLEASRETPYDLVLLDIKMPEMSGSELYQLLLERDLCPAERVVFVTGDTLSKETAAFLAEAGRPLLSKPFTVQQLQETLLHARAEG